MFGETLGGGERIAGGEQIDELRCSSNLGVRENSRDWHDVDGVVRLSKIQNLAQSALFVGDNCIWQEEVRLDFERS